MVPFSLISMVVLNLGRSRRVIVTLSIVLVILGVVIVMAITRSPDGYLQSNAHSLAWTNRHTSSTTGTILSLTPLLILYLYVLAS